MKVNAHLAAAAPVIAELLLQHLRWYEGAQVDERLLIEQTRTILKKAGVLL